LLPPPPMMSNFLVALCVVTMAVSGIAGPVQPCLEKKCAMSYDACRLNSGCDTAVVKCLASCTAAGCDSNCFTAAVTSMPKLDVPLLIALDVCGGYAGCFPSARLSNIAPVQPLSTEPQPSVASPLRASLPGCDAQGHIRGSKACYPPQLVVKTHSIAQPTPGTFVVNITNPSGIYPYENVSISLYATASGLPANSSVAIHAVTGFVYCDGHFELTKVPYTVTRRFASGVWKHDLLLPTLDVPIGANSLAVVLSMNTTVHDDPYKNTCRNMTQFVCEDTPAGMVCEWCKPSNRCISKKEECAPSSGGTRHAEGVIEFQEYQMSWDTWLNYTAIPIN